MAGNFQEAAAICRKIIEKNKTWAPARPLAGLVSFQLGDVDGARKSLARAAALSRQPHALLDLVQIKRVCGNSAAAIARARDAIKCDASLPQAHLLLADMLDDAKDWKGAADVCERALMKWRPNCKP